MPPSISAYKRYVRAFQDDIVCVLIEFRLATPLVVQA